MFKNLREEAEAIYDELYGEIETYHPIYGQEELEKRRIWFEKFDILPEEHQKDLIKKLYNLL